VKIILAILLLASNAWAGIAANTVVLYKMENNQGDSSGNGYGDWYSDVPLGVLSCHGCSRVPTP